STEPPPDGSTKIPAQFLNKYWAPQEAPVAHIIRRQYRLREGDAMEVIYHVRHQMNEIYKIKVQDIIIIRFPYQRSLDQTEQVHSDGRLHLDLIGPVKAYGRTIDELNAELKQRYSAFLKNPVLTVSFKESNVKIRELKEAIITSPRGQSRLVPITPDGTLSLPFIINVRAAGRTADELHNVLNQAYQDIGLSELEVTVNVQSVAPLRVFVFGEVKSPGAVLNEPDMSTSVSEMSLLQAIAQSGGYIPGRAELSMVTLMRRRHLPKPDIAIVNVRQLLENRERACGKPVVGDSSKHRYDIWLEDGDVIYVPTSEIAKRADYIELVWTRGIRAVTNHSFIYTATDVVDWLGPNP
ncbi:MAG: polysaccharide biosynthesis/export family protein, partial [Phycisphaerae bacterium]|nr:polysaccharide biosynthesis/export family protein [Phycisphaerae bacterium]